MVKAEESLSFETEPLTEELLKIKQMENPLMAKAINNNITIQFMKMIKFKIDHRQLINMNCVGKPRSGKSWSMIALCFAISDYTKIPFGVENILHNQSEYLNVIKNGLPNTIYLIDEFEVSDAFGVGATAEWYQQTDVMRICAKRILHRINLVGEDTSISTNADYTLATVGIDYEHFATKLLVYRLERGSEIPIGYIVIPVSPIICDDIKQRKQYGCLMCPKYITDECNCFLKHYEKKKDKNISRIAEQNFNFRSKIRIQVARDLLNDEKFLALTKKGEQLVYVRNLAPRYTNRTLTEKEFEEIVTIARMAKKDAEMIGQLEQAQPEYQPVMPVEGEGEEDDKAEGQSEEDEDGKGLQL